MRLAKSLRNWILENVPTQILSLLNSWEAQSRNELSESVVLREGTDGFSPRIFIDTTRLSRLTRVTGITRVVTNLGRAIAGIESARNHNVTFFEFGTDGFLHARSTASLGGTEKPGSIQTGMQVALRPGDVVLFPDVTSPPNGPSAREVTMLRELGVRVFFIGYDLLPKTYPEFFLRYSRLVYDKWFEAALRANGILFISQATERDFLRFLAETPEGQPFTPRTGFAHLACEVPVGVAEAAAKRKSLLGKECFSFLMVGTIEPRKGHQAVVEAFEQLWKQGHHHSLTILGGTGWLAEDFERRIRRHPQLGQRLFFLDNAGDDQAWEQYLTADALIANSEAEGYGLPLIEAASIGLPIIARAIDPFIEIAGNHAFYVDSGGPQYLARALQEWCALASEGTNPDSRKIPVRTWSEVAVDTLSFMLES